MDTILVVDDESNYLTVMEALLGEAGYEVLTAPSALEALKIAGASDLDLVLTDMKMPKMSGIELLEEFNRLYPELPVIIMTAYGTVEKAVTAMKKGAFDYILKPFKNEEILVTIAKALEHTATSSSRTACSIQELDKKIRLPQHRGGKSKVMRGNPGPGQTGGPIPGHRPDHRRERHRQRTHRPSHPPVQSPRAGKNFMSRSTAPR
jgi:DNA-binding NtrC family response regulator